MVQDTNARRTLLKHGAIAGAALGVGMLIRDDNAYAQQTATAAGPINAGDVAILRFLAAAELIETDLWAQYAELAQHNPGYNAALRGTDPSVVQYAVDTERDEKSHAVFINAYLASIGAEPVNLDAFRTIPSVAAPGAQQVKRLTNLRNLTVDTSWYVRYRTAQNPDFGDKVPQLLSIVNRPTVPTSSVVSGQAIQTIADTALFHFAAIEQGGASLYNTLLPKVSNLDVLRILAAIGPVEAIHFGVFQTSLEGLAPLTSPDGKLVFPDLRNNKQQSQSVLPAPTRFLNKNLPLNSVIRPGTDANSGALAAATGLVKSNLFQGQSNAFFDAVVALAKAADAAVRTV